MFNQEICLIVDLVKFSATKHLLNIYGRGLKCQHFVTVKVNFMLSGFSVALPAALFCIINSKCEERIESGKETTVISKVVTGTY